MEKALGLIGLMRKANAISIGEDDTGAAARSRKAALLLLASDASDNARKRIESFGRIGNVRIVRLPFTKDEISAATGKRGCSMAAVCDSGFAAALLKLLPPDTANDEATHECLLRNDRTGKRRNNA